MVPALSAPRGRWDSVRSIGQPRLSRAEQEPEATLGEERVAIAPNDKSCLHPADAWRAGRAPRSGTCRSPVL